MREPIRQTVLRHVERRRLSPRQLRALDALQFRDAHRPSRWWRHPWAGWGVAAGLLLVLLAGWLLRPAQAPIEVRIAEEVAANHLKLKPLEVETGEMKRIREYFRELDFVPVTSELVASTDLGLLGGRYCSIQGAAAAQLRVRTPRRGGPSTLYQAPYIPGMYGGLPRYEAGERPLTVWAQGMPVQIWVEKGVLFALTGGHEPVLPIGPE